jgi:sulfatase modifying factor 1
MVDSANWHHPFGQKEEAARFKTKGKYNWGEKYEGQANIWTGHFPEVNTREDGFLFSSPVCHFGKNAAGLSDRGGNVWQ